MNQIELEARVSRLLIDAPSFQNLVKAAKAARKSIFGELSDSYCQQIKINHGAY